MYFLITVNIHVAFMIQLPEWHSTELGKEITSNLTKHKAEDKSSL